jgi:peptidyl-prolyl cis-trans isomerase SurA
MPARATAAEAAVVDRIVAVVNEDIITLYDIETIVQPILKNLKSQGLSPERQRQVVGNLRSEMLDNLVNVKLTEQEVKRHKITVTEEEIDNQLRQIKQRRSLTDESLRALLAQEGMTLQEYRNEVKLQIQRTKLVNREVKSKVVVTEAEIKDYYEKNRSKYGGGTQYYLWNLFVKLSPNPIPMERQNAQALLTEALAELKRGRSFQELARINAEGSKGIQGSELGMFQVDELTPQLREVVRGMKAGQVSPIVESEFGYQIVYVEKIQETPAKPLKQVESEIQEILFRESVDSRFTAWLADLRKRSHIKIMDTP